MDDRPALKSYLVEVAPPSPPSGGGHMVLIVLIVLTIIIIVAFVIARRAERKAISSNAKTLLSLAGWELYVQPGCDHCTAQLALLGGHYPKTVECGGDAESAKCKQFSAFPTWVNPQSKQTRVGVQGTEELLLMALGSN